MDFLNMRFRCVVGNAAPGVPQGFPSMGMFLFCGNVYSMVNKIGTSSPNFVTERRGRRSLRTMRDMEGICDARTDRRPIPES